MATLATSFGKHLPRVILVEDLVKPTELEVMKVEVFQIKVGPNWMDPIVLFLREEMLSLEGEEAEKVQRKALYFWLSEEQKLYKFSFQGHIYFMSILSPSLGSGRPCAFSRSLDRPCLGEGVGAALKRSPPSLSENL